MAYRELELTLLSAQELKSVNLITRMDVYAVVSISNDPLTRQCTEPDTYGGRNPCWNATFRFAVPPTSAAAAASSASLHVLLRAERFLGDRDVGEVVIPLSGVLAGATGVGPQPPQVASYQVRKLHRREPRGVLNVAYRLGPVVAPVVERANSEKQPPAYAPVGVQPPKQPGYQHPSAAAAYYQYPAPPPAPGRPDVRVAVAVHDEAAQKKSPVMAYPAVGVPPQQQASHAPAKPDAYRPPPSPSPSPPPPRPAAVHAATHEEAHRAPTPPAPAPTPPAAPAPAPAPPAANGGRRNDGHGQAGPTHFYMGPNSQIIFSRGGHTTVSSGPPPRTTSPARSIISPGGKKGDGNWALQLTQGGYASAADSMSVSVPSPRSRNEDRWRPNGLSQSQHDTQQQQQAASSPVAAAASPHRLAAAASPFSSRSSSFSSPLSPYSSAHPSPSPSSAHSSTHSPYHYSAHPSAAASPHQPLRSPAASDGAHGTNNTFRSTTPSRGAAISSPLPSSSPMIPNHSHGSAVSSPLPWSSHMVPKNSSVVPTL